MIRRRTGQTAGRGGKPRASGDDPAAMSVVSIGFSVNPARAGMIRRMRTRPVSVVRKPRASGDDPRGDLS